MKQKRKNVDMRPKRRGCSRRLLIAVLGGIALACGLTSYVISQTPEGRARMTAQAITREHDNQQATRDAVIVSNQRTATARAQPAATSTIASTMTASATITDTPPVAASATPDERVYADLTLYTTGESRLRECPATTCEAVATVPIGTTLQSEYRVIGEDAFGRGEANWYAVTHSGREAFVYAGVVALTQPATAAPAVPAPARVWDCSGNYYNCTDFQNHSELRSYWNACPGDPSKLDADRDGLPCELDY